MSDASVVSTFRWAKPSNLTTKAITNILFVILTDTIMSQQRIRLFTGLALGVGFALVSFWVMQHKAGSRQNYPAIVQTDAGWVRGDVTTTLRRFQGIPYAAPPVNSRRWQAPQPAPGWTGIRDATRPCSACPQQPTSYANIRSTNEDCLFLNITTPRSATVGDRKPVMVWIHGDGSVGAGHLFDPARLVTIGDVVVVTINYRLGIFGGFGYPGLAGSGTFGLQDQQAALRWVQRNISRFGGDPDNVTLFGVSYGALSASAHLMSPAAKGLFHKMILQSGFALMDMPAGSMMPDMEAMPWFGWRSREEIEQLGVYVAQQLKRRDLATLHQASVQELLPFLPLFQPYGYQTTVLPMVPDQALATGKFNQVPVLAGTTQDEHRTFVGLFRELAGQPVTKANYDSLLIVTFGKQARAVKKRYPLTAYASPAVAWATVLTDRMWARATFRQHQVLSNYVPVYAYEFVDRNAPSSLPFPKSMPPGAFHSGEVDYLFADQAFDAKLTPAQRQLSDRMIRYWTNFARSGNPNGRDLPDWKRFVNQDSIPYVQGLAPGTDSVQVIDYAKTHQLDFWRIVPIP